MVQAALKRDERYSYADYLRWDDGERWELINGAAYNMTPAPSTTHQRISKRLLVQFEVQLRGKRCEVFDAPYDIRLPAPGETAETTSTVVQPDLVVVCDPSKIVEHGCIGPPDLVIEILSQYTSAKDLKEKFLLYQSAGVREYWVVHPSEQTVLVFRRGEDGTYGRPERYASEDHVPVGIIPELEIDLGMVFAQ